MNVMLASRCLNADVSLSYVRTHAASNVQTEEEWEAELFPRSRARRIVFALLSSVVSPTLLQLLVLLAQPAPLRLQQGR